MLIKKAHLLIHNENNNKSVHFMSLLAKYNGGKRYNLTMRGSFNNRVNMSALTYNTRGPNWQYSSWKHLTKKSPGKVWKRYLRNKDYVLSYRRRYRSNACKKLFLPKVTSNNITTISEGNHDYGVYAIEPDMPSNSCRMNVNEF